MNKVALAIGAGCAVAAATVGTLALRSQEPALAPAARPLGTFAAEQEASFQADWQAALAKLAQGEDETLWEVAERWLAHDPGAVMDAVMRLEGFDDRKRWALSLWLEADFQAAKAWVHKAFSWEAEALVFSAFELFAARDPAAALDVAVRASLVADFDEPDRLAMDALDRGDKAAMWRVVFKWVDSLVPEFARLRVELASRALRAWAHDDIVGAWQAAQEVRLPGEGVDPAAWKNWRGELSTAVLDIWLASGWHEPLTVMATTEDAYAPKGWQRAAIGHWAETAPAAALEWVSSLPRFDAADRVDGVVSRREALGAALATMAIHWPHEAKAAMEDEIGDSPQNTFDIYNTHSHGKVIRHFAETADPRQVAAWFDSQPDLVLRGLYAEDVARAYAAAHPKEALEWARRLPSRYEYADAVWAVITTNTGEVHERAAKSLLEIGDPDLVEDVADSLLERWGKADPLAALRWAENHAPKNWNAKQRVGIFHTWALDEPVAAAAHLSEILDAEERMWATRYVVNGTFQGVARRKEEDEALRPQLARETDWTAFVPAAERLYNTLPREARSKHVAYFLYRHYEHTDPQRATRYQAEAEDDHGDPWDFY